MDARAAPVGQGAAVPEEAQVVLRDLQQGVDGGSHARRVAREQLKWVIVTHTHDAALSSNTRVSAQVATQFVAHHAAKRLQNKGPRYRDGAQARWRQMWLKTPQFTMTTNAGLSARTYLLGE